MRSGPPAVVIGLGSVTGLQSARILARRGVRVIGVTGNLRHFAARTRVCERVVQADVHGPGLVAALEQLGRELDQRPVLYPCTDQAVLVVSRHREALAELYRVVLPPDDVVRTLSDKVTFAEHAAAHGLPVPWTFPLSSRVDAEAAAAALPYPSVLKPSMKSPAWKRETGAKAVPVGSPDELLAAYDSLAPWAEALVAQQYVEGSDEQLFTCNCYLGADGRPLVTFMTRKRRQWPPHVGTASYGEECRDDEILALTLRLFETVPFRGLGYLEVKRDARTRQPYLIEANIGRPTGRSATAEAGGVELLYTMYCDAVGLPLPTSREQTDVGAGWLDLRRDVMSAVHYWRRGELTPLEWYRSVRGPKAHAVLSVRDPLPFAMEILQSSSNAARRALRRRRARRPTP